MDLKLFFKKLTDTFQLGDLLSDAVRVHGGFMHMMYKLDTSKGVYAIKLLNPNVMKRAEAMANYFEADRLEIILQNHNIPIVPSLTFNDKKMQELDGQYFYLYDWYDGKALKDKDIQKMHCQKIGKELYRIHNIDVRNKKYQQSQINIDWDYYIELSQNQRSPIYDLLVANKDLLYESQQNGNLALEKVPNVLTICHNDMDSKNVLWHGDEYRLIDLECLSYSNPYLELFELALCWSGYEECDINFDLFNTFIDAYFSDNPKPKFDWEALYYSNYGRLEWLEYNVKRALLIECDSADEQKMGVEQVKETIDHVIYYNSVKDKIIECLSKGK